MDYKNARLVASSQVMVVVVPHVILITALSTKPFFLLFLGLLRPLTFESYFGLRLWTALDSAGLQASDLRLRTQA